MSIPVEKAQIEKRFELLVSSRLRRKSNIIKAVEVQDRIRKKAGVWEGSKEIRKWRDRR
jgi:hypothetical protein